MICATNAQPDFGCRLTDYGSPVSTQNNTLTDPLYNSFAYPCNGDNAHSGGWQISWGYNNNQDSAVVRSSLSSCLESVVIIQRSEKLTMTR
jgi:hypothetical protein